MLYLPQCAIVSFMNFSLISCCLFSLPFPPRKKEVVAFCAAFFRFTAFYHQLLCSFTGNPEEDDGAQSSDEDEDKYVEKMDMPGTKVDAAERYTVRNLRIREDTAKYLRNLDPNSAYYDPKTRAMRKNPYEDLGKGDEEVDYAGDNFVRVTGDTVEHAKAQLFAWEAGGKG